MNLKFQGMLDAFVYGDLNRCSKAHIKRQLRRFGCSYNEFLNQAYEHHLWSEYNSIKDKLCWH